MTTGRVLVLGHTGFIGRPLVAALRARASWDVVGRSVGELDLATADAGSRLVPLLDRDTSVVVLAGLKKQLGDTLDIFERNVAIAAAVCRAIERQPVRRVIFYSSAEVYGETTDDVAMTEGTPVRPTSYYGVAKFASEGIFRKAAAKAGASLAILRPPLVYGPGDESLGYGPSGFARAAVRRQPITLWGEGTERRDFLFLDDLVDVTCRLVASDAAGVVNVASGTSSSFRDVLAAIERALGEPPIVTMKPRTRPSVDQGYRVDRLRRILPEFAPTPLDEGLRRLLEHERQLVTTT